MRCALPRDRRNALRPHAHAADPVAHRLLAVRHRQGRQAPRSSRTAGRAALGWTDAATPMRHAVSARPVFVATIRRRSCWPLCIESPRWPSGGRSAPTKVPSTTRICTRTSTSSCSASTGVTPAAKAWCSTECSSVPFGTHRCATQTLARAIDRARGHPSLRPRAGYTDEPGARDRRSPTAVRANGEPWTVPSPHGGSRANAGSSAAVVCEDTTLPSPTG